MLLVQSADGLELTHQLLAELDGARRRARRVARADARGRLRRAGHGADERRGIRQPAAALALAGCSISRPSRSSGFFLLVARPAADDLRDASPSTCSRPGSASGDAALRGARRRADGHLVVDALRLGRRHPVAALAGHARAAGRRAARRCVSIAAAAHASPRPRSASTRSPATLVWGRLLFDDAARARAPAACSPSRCRPPCLPGPARAGARLDVRPLPQRERVLEPARVPGLAGHRPARAALAAARLRRADLVGARARPGGCAPCATRRSAATRWPAIGMCLLLGGVYLVLGAVTASHHFERLARARRRPSR